MSNIDFVDQVGRFFAAGKGGAGVVHFRRERYLPNGGPDGGNGGRGGHIVLVGNPHRTTLLHLRAQKRILAQAGRDGAAKRCDGANGADQILDVPLGTLVRDEATGKLLCEITTAGQRHILLHGGRGGRGNAYFRSSTCQAPRHAQPGELGEAANLILELRILADVALLGPPNAGKSTLLSTLSAARPTIANYPFTTLTPQLGIVAYYDKSFVMAEIPGLIKGASQGRGLGLRFLRHAQRSKVLLCLLPADAPSLTEAYHTLLQELTNYSPSFANKKCLWALTKTDLLHPEALTALCRQFPASTPLLPLSSLANSGIAALKASLWNALSMVS